MTKKTNNPKCVEEILAKLRRLRTLNGKDKFLHHIESSIWGGKKLPRGFEEEVLQKNAFNITLRNFNFLRFIYI